MAKKLSKEEAEAFYSSALELINKSGFPYLVGGTYASMEHTGIRRPTKDLDLFCKVGDYPQILAYFKENGFEIEMTDPRWVVKVVKQGQVIDFVFNNTSGLMPVKDSWFEHAVSGELFGVKVKFPAPEELLWSKIYRQERTHYDGSDVNHIILKRGKEMDWKRILNRMDQHWQLLMSQLFNFAFVFPSEKQCIPKWVFEELWAKHAAFEALPDSKEKICRGPLVSHAQYRLAIEEWGYQLINYDP